LCIFIHIYNKPYISLWPIRSQFDMDLARAPRRRPLTARKKGCGYENDLNCTQKIKGFGSETRQLYPFEIFHDRGFPRGPTRLKSRTLDSEINRNQTRNQEITREISEIRNQKF
jgi:hypothetical protein